MMRFIIHIFSFVLLIFIVSCSSKPAPIIQKPPKVIKPAWIENHQHDSAYVYSVYKVEKKEASILNDLVYNQMEKMIEDDFLNHLKNIADSTNLDFSMYVDAIIEKRILRASKYFTKPEKFIDKNHLYALLKFDKKSFTKAFENDLSDTLYLAQQIINNISDDISEKNFKRISKSLGLIINYIGYGSLISSNNIDKDVVQLILQLKKITHTYNDRIQLAYKSDYLQKMPLVNESKRVILISKHLLSGKMLSGLWIEARSESFDESDLLISKENGSMEYQVRSLNQITNGYKLQFNVAFNVLLNDDLVKLFNLNPKKCKLSVMPKSPKMFFENSINNFDNSLKDLPVVDAIKKCFEKKYSASFTSNKKESSIAIELDVITQENADKISKIYPNFVHASGHLTIRDSNSNEEFFNQKIFEESGSDFNSIEKAGINSLMNLAKVVSLKICG